MYAKKKRRAVSAIPGFGDPYQEILQVDPPLYLQRVDEEKLYFITVNIDPKKMLVDGLRQTPVIQYAMTLELLYKILQKYSKVGCLNFELTRKHNLHCHMIVKLESINRMYEMILKLEKVFGRVDPNSDRIRDLRKTYSYCVKEKAVNVEVMHPFPPSLQLSEVPEWFCARNKILKKIRQHQKYHKLLMDHKCNNKDD